MSPQEERDLQRELTRLRLATTVRPGMNDVEALRAQVAGLRSELLAREHERIEREEHDRTAREEAMASVQRRGEEERRSKAIEELRHSAWTTHIVNTEANFELLRRHAFDPLYLKALAGEKAASGGWPPEIGDADAFIRTNLPHVAESVPEPTGLEPALVTLAKKMGLPI